MQLVDLARDDAKFEQRDARGALRVALERLVAERRQHVSEAGERALGGWER